jgi:translation initiation factor IF-2
MAGKPIRLGKAASELNVGLPTLVEFLGSKGISIDSNPNTKLDPEHFQILCTEFAADQTLKEQAKGSSLKEKKESISLKDTRQESPVEEKQLEEQDILD